jgi:hypothetical protein
MDDLLDEMNWKIRKWYAGNSEFDLKGGKKVVASIVGSKMGS